MIPVFKPLISKKDKISVLRALNNGEISGNFGKTINYLSVLGTKVRHKPLLQYLFPVGFGPSSKI